MMGFKLRYSNYINALDNKLDLRTSYMHGVNELINFANKYFDDEKPWTIKDDPDRLRNILLNLVEILYHITILVAPFLPRTAEKMREIFVHTTSGLADFRIDPDFQLTQENKNIRLVTIPLLFERK